MEFIRNYDQINKKTKKWEVRSEPLCNFRAQIARDIVEDDGSGQTRRRFEIETCLGVVTIKAEEFDGMGWVTKTLGSGAVVEPGDAVRRQLAVAIKVLSDPAHSTVFTHLGWRKVGGVWRFLHAGGTIPDDNEIELSLDPPLSDYKLAPPPTDARDAVAASMGLIFVAPPHVAWPLLAATYRAPLAAFAPISSSVFITGQTGSLKTALARLAQSHFGTAWASRDPANWLSTANSIERVAFLAKDALLLIDDYVPPGAVQDRGKLAAFADRLFRGAANHAGRRRMAADTSLRAEYYPRGMLLATGEDIPPGHSLRARLHIVQVQPGDIDKKELSKVQRAASDGILAEAMAAYVAWVATRKTSRFPRRLNDLRRDARQRLDQGHARTPENVADLMLGAETFLRFARAVGVIDDALMADLEADAWEALTSASTAQATLQEDVAPGARFLRLLPDAITAGRAHLANPRGTAPRNPGALGWRPRKNSGGDDEREGFEPRGDLIGYIVRAELYLIPEAAFAVVQRMAQDQQHPIPLSPAMLWARLKDEGRIVRHERIARRSEKCSTENGCTSYSSTRACSGSPCRGVARRKNNGALAWTTWPTIRKPTIHKKSASHLPMARLAHLAHFPPEGCEEAYSPLASASPEVGFMKFTGPNVPNVPSPDVVLIFCGSPRSPTLSQLSHSGGRGKIPALPVLHPHAAKLGHATRAVIPVARASPI